MKDPQVVLAKWSKKLNIDPFWKISLQQMDLSDRLAETHFSLDRWEAVIYISPLVSPSDLEKVIIHELLELSLYEINGWITAILMNHIGDAKALTTYEGVLAFARNRVIEKLIPTLLGGHNCAQP